MKHLYQLFFTCAVSFLAGDERVYLPSENLSVSERGIFFRSNRFPVPLSSISYDYEKRQFYLSRDVVLITCPSCGQKMYDPINEVCFNSDCQRYW